jgi:bifunctional non-homologous end joining protein LigD
LYPEAGFTKGNVIDYYTRVTPVLLPHLRERPLTLKRYPDGVEGQYFYEKHCPSHRPPWVDTTSVVSHDKKTTVDYCLANDLPSVIWVAQLASIELHTSLARAVDYQCPTMVVFDLDPGLPAHIVDCAQVALWLRELFDDLGLEAFPKTSGSKGLQVYVPLNTPTSYEKTKPFAHAVALLLEKQHQGQVVSHMDKSLRRGKVLIDWSQNHDTKTTVCVYSLRASPRPTASTPVTWDEVASCVSSGRPEQLIFEAREVLERVSRHGDFFAPVASLEQELPTFLGRA